MAIRYESAPPTTRLAKAKEIPTIPGYGWVTERYLRHLIFNAQDRKGSGGTIIRGNGFAPAIIKLGRRILIDLNEFDVWIDAHRTSAAQLGRQ